MRRALVVAPILAACASSYQPAPDPWSSSSPPVREIVGWLDERPVTYGEFARYLRTRDPQAFFRNLESYLLERVTRAEAKPLGITVPAGLLAADTARRIDEWDRSVRAESRRQTGEEVDPALWLERVAGMSMAQFRKEVRRHTEVELLQDRLLRYEQLTSRRIELSLLVVQEEEEARRLFAELQRGADFAALAKKLSVHASKSEGGRLRYPFVSADINDAAVREELFKAEEQSLLGPFATPRGFREIYRVEAIHPARAGAYAELAGEVARDLERRPVAMGEYERWRRRILLRHGFHAAPPPGDLE